MDRTILSREVLSREVLTWEVRPDEVIACLLHPSVFLLYIYNVLAILHSVPNLYIRRKYGAS